MNHFVECGQRLYRWEGLLQYARSQPTHVPSGTSNLLACTGTRETSTLVTTGGPIRWRPYSLRIASRRSIILSMQEILSRYDDPEVPLQGQEFYELRLFEEPNQLGIRHGVLQIHAKWNDANGDVLWDSEEIDYFWILGEAEKRYAERRLALVQMGFIYSDMDW